MKHWNRFLAALLTAMVLCAPVVAEEAIVLDDGGEILPAQGAAGDGLEIDAEAMPEMPENLGIELDDALALSGDLGLAGDESADGKEMPGQAGQAEPAGNASSDFVIKNGVLVEYKGKGGDVVIPYGVKYIGERAFYRCKTLTSVTIPSSVLMINDGDSFRNVGAFYGCKKLTKVIMKKGITHIGNSAFSYCTSLTSVSIPDSVTCIDWWAFGGCTKLARITIPNSVTTIGISAFNYCKSLTNVTIPSSVTDIDNWAFGNCPRLDDATILSKKITISNNSVFTNDVRLHIVKGSDAIRWAKVNGFRYDIIKISDSTLKLNIGQTHTLTVNGFKNNQLTWSISNKKVAMVSNGKVKAVGTGKCTVSAKAKGVGTFKCNVTVIDSAKLSKTSLTISAVDSATVKLTGASGKKVTWTSSKSGVAKITKSSNGSVTVKGVKPGTAVIQAKIAGGQTLKCTVKVVAPMEMTTVKIVLEWGKRMLYTRFTNQSGKKITFIKCDILQYNYWNQKLKSPYKNGFDLTTTIEARASVTKMVDVHGETDHVEYKILQVRFSDGTTWRP